MRAWRLTRLRLASLVARGLGQQAAHFVDGRQVMDSGVGLEVEQVEVGLADPFLAYGEAFEEVLLTDQRGDAVVVAVAGERLGVGTRPLLRRRDPRGG